MNEPEDHLRGVGLHGLGFIAARGNLLVQIVARVARGSVDVRALRERILVADRARNAGRADAAVVDELSIAPAEHQEHFARTRRDVRACRNAVALHHAVAELAVAELKRHDFRRARQLPLIVEILAGQIELAEVELVVRADRNGEAVVGLLRVGALAAPGRPFNRRDGAQAFAAVRNADRAVAVRRAFVFFRAFRTVVRIGVRRPLEVAGEAGKRRRLVGDHVVEAARVEAEDVLVAGNVVAPADGERVENRRCDAPGAVTGREVLESAEGERAERVVGDVERSFAAEHAGAGRLGEFAGIGFEAVFQDEADLEAVAEIFRALDAEARAEAHAGLDAEFVIGGVAVVEVLADVGQTFVDDAVELNFSGRCASRDGAENGAAENFLVH